MERHRQFERIKEAAKEDQKTKQHTLAAEPAAPTIAPAKIVDPALEKTPAKPTASLDTPATKITEASTQRRITDLQKVLEVAAI